jgi:hypothetical protein
MIRYPILWRNMPPAAIFVLISSLATAVPARSVMAGEIIIATNEFTADWNPLSQSTFPAAVASRLVAESLFVPRCLSQQSKSDTRFQNICAHPSARVSQFGSLRLVIDPKKCSLNGRPLTAKDINFTLDEIKADQNNDFRVNGIAINRGRLRVGFPRNPPEYVAKSIYSFPILRKYDGDNNRFQLSDPGSFSRRRIDRGDEELSNIFTGGRYKFGDIDTRSVTLEAREKRSSSDEITADRIRFVYFDRLLDLKEVMGQDEGRPDVVLSYPLDKAAMVSRERYSARQSAELASVTYLGYNFRTKHEKFRALVRDREFRALMTASLWSIPVIRRTIGIGKFGIGSRGVFLGASPDVDVRQAADAPSANNVRREIQKYLSIRRLPSSLTMRVLLSPGVVNRQLDEADRRNIQSELENLWLPVGEFGGVAFEFVDPTGGMRGYKSDIKENEFHMVIDNLVYGRKKMRYIHFLHPDSQSNFLGVDLFSTTEIDQFMAEGAQGRMNFLNAFKRLHPFSVIGHFPSRILISTAVQASKNCPEGSLPVPLSGLHGWFK